ncbi:MAG: hypothetical protein ACXVEF_16380 [Polyangiales bacterium]
MLTVAQALRDLEVVTREVVMGRPNLGNRMTEALEALRAVTPPRGKILLQVLHREASKVERDDGARRTFFHAARALVTLNRGYPLGA